MLGAILLATALPVLAFVFCAACMWLMMAVLEKIGAALMGEDE